MADIKKARAQAKVCLTRCTSNINRLSADVESGVDLSVEKCEFAISDFECKLKCYDEKQSLFELELEDEAMLVEIEAGDDYRTKQTEVMVKLKECLNNIKEEKKASSPVPVSDVDTNSGTPHSKPVHLPKLQLLHFGGNIIDFQGFWDKFVALIDSRDDLCPVNVFLSEVLVAWGSKVMPSISRLSPHRGQLHNRQGNFAKKIWKARQSHCGAHSRAPQHLPVKPYGRYMSKSRYMSDPLPT